MKTDSLNPSSSDLLNAHVLFNLGVYFDNRITVGRSVIVTSNRIPDFYWNFAYCSDDGSFTDVDLTQVSQCLAARARRPAIWQRSTDAHPPHWNVRSTEAWLWRDNNEMKMLDDAAEQGEVQLITTDRPNAGMRVVFDNAYSSGGSPGDVGYFSLPSEYGDAFENGHPTPPCTHRHFAAYIDGKCVGVGTACLNGDIAGIYSVATHRSFRRRGVGTLISAEASRWALKHAAKGIVLQTEADSPVEQMYLQLGFKRSFLGTLLTPYSE